MSDRRLAISAAGPKSYRPDSHLQSDTAMDGMPRSVASIAAAIVPEYVTSSPMFGPRFIPATTRSGCFGRSSLRARRTQSVGVPSTPMTLSLMRCVRRGTSIVSEWLAPLLSLSGATTVTSAIFSSAALSAFMPGA